jgi:hypothetical protein
MYGLWCRCNISSILWLAAVLLGVKIRILRHCRWTNQKEELEIK